MVVLSILALTIQVLLDSMSAQQLRKISDSSGGEESNPFELLMHDSKPCIAICTPEPSIAESRRRIEYMYSAEELQVRVYQPCQVSREPIALWTLPLARPRAEDYGRSL